MAINFRGYLFQDDGDAVNGATVQLLETGTTTVEASTTTDSDGLWYFNEGDQDKYDIKITSGTSVRYIRWDDQISLKEIDIRNNTGNTTPAATFTNLTNNAANQVAVFSGANTTRADDDEIYTSFKLANSAAELIEYGRMTVVAKDVTDGTEDGQIEFDVMKAGTLTKVWTITSSDAAAMSFDMNVDSLTIGSGADTDISLTFDANTADGVITWMEDEDYFKFSDEILMNSTEKILFGDTATFIHQSSDGVMTVDGEATIDLNASTAVLVSNDLKLNSDSAVLGFGADNDTTLTHTDGTGLTLNSTNKLTFGDTGTFIHQSSDGVLTITSDTTVDINGAVAFDGALTGITALTVDDVVVDGKVMTMTGSASDTAVFTAGTNGTLSIVTTDAAAAAANIQITADGTVDIDSAGVLTLDSGAAINIEPASGSAILLDGTISIDAGVVTGATSITSTAFVGDITGDVTGTADVATVATTVTITDNESTNESNAVIFTAGGDVDGGNLGLESDGTLTYNPSTGKVTATGFIGTLTGNVTGDVTGNVTGNTSGTAATVTTAAQTNITSLGTLTALQVDNLNLNGNTFSSTNSDGDITISGNDGGSTVVAQHIDMSGGGISVFGGGTASAADTNTKMYKADAGPINILGTGHLDTNIIIGRWDDNAAGGTLAFIKDRDGTIGGSTELQDGDELGKIWFASGDGTVNAYTYTRESAVFSAYSDGVTASNDNPAGFKWELNPGGEDANSAEVMRLNKNGSLFIGDTENTGGGATGVGVTAGSLTINQGTNLNEILSFKSSDIAHGMTGNYHAETDTFGHFKKINDTAGGLEISGFSETTRGLSLNGYHVTDNTTHTAGANAAVMIRGFLKSSTTSTNPASGANILVLRGSAESGVEGQVTHIFDSDGNTWFEGADQTAFDDYDDAQLVRAFDMATNKGVVQNKWDGFVQYNEQKLIDLNILGDTVENHGLVNSSALLKLHNGAIWQGYTKHQEMQERIHTLESRLLALESK